MKTIILSVGYEPIAIVGWFKAFTLVYEGKADILYAYEKKIKSAHSEWERPAIIVLKTEIKRRAEKMVNPSTRSILIRDLYTCQYCGVKLNNTSGTKDHVTPLSKGGKNTWTNLVAACKPCQGKKADYMPDVCGMYPKRPPKVPSFKERFFNSMRIASSVERKTWKKGLDSCGLGYMLEELEEHYAKAST
jgi:5-methylcytosine-specific restriction endonuclease McrA